MTCGLLVLSTLLNEVSLCTNSRSKDLLQRYGYLSYRDWVFYVILYNEMERQATEWARESHGRLDFILA